MPLLPRQLMLALPAAIFPALLLIVLLPLNGIARDYAMNELPMYGGEHDPQVETDKQNSKDAAELGWRYLYRGEELTAMKRFNQAWMFNRKNPEAYWGFGILMGRRSLREETEKNLIESIKFLQMARGLSPENGKILGDLAHSHSLLGNYLTIEGKEGKPHFDQAETLFAEAHKREPKYPPISVNWAVLKLHTGDYASAKKLVSEAQRLGFKPDPEFLKELEEKSRTENELKKN